MSGNPRNDYDEQLHNIAGAVKGLSNNGPGVGTLPSQAFASGHINNIKKALEKIESLLREHAPK